MESAIRFFQAPAKSYFLFGPRGTGKSTWIREHYPDALILDLLAPEVYREYKAHPERFRQWVLAHSKQTLFVIDEVQKVPGLLDVVHELIELKRGWIFVLTGSSARKLKQQGVDLLAGRALRKVMHPFMAAELAQQFDFERGLRYGMLPVFWESKEPREDLAAYVALYMKEEVQQEGLVRHIEHFARFLETISFSQGSILSYANIARDCHLNAKTVENYVSILEDLLLSFKVPVFTKKAKRVLSAHAKFYYFDTGVFQALRPQGPLDGPAEMAGIALESLVGQHLRAWIDYSQETADLSFWRTKSGLEVDFVVYGTLGFYAIEVKNTATIKPNDVRGLVEFGKDYPESQRIMVYRGARKLLKDGILYYPAEEFVRALKPNQMIE